MQKYMKKVEKLGKREEGGYPQALSKQDMTRCQGMSVDIWIYYTYTYGESTFTAYVHDFC